MALSAKALETNFPTIAGEKPTPETTFPALVKYLFNFAFFIGSLVVFGRTVQAGFQYITSRDNPAVVKEARKKIYDALLGLLILFATFIILKTINPNLVSFSLPPLIKAPETPANEQKEINP